MRRSSHQRPRPGKLAITLVFSALGCAPPTPPPRPAPSVLVVGEPTPEPEEPEAAPAGPTCTPAPRPSRRATTPDAVPVAPDDPVAGRFELLDAIQGLSGRWPLTARIHTDHGTLSCELWEDAAPITVANFVGLARGLRPWKRGAEWVTEPAYQGGSFHRVIPGFMIQGGDPLGTGTGEPGYVIPDEIDPGVRADRVGLLYMAHRGRNTGGMQFFVMDGPAPHIDGGYTAFGLCGPEDVIHDIANAPKLGEHPEPPVRIRSIEVSLTPGCE